MRDLTPVTDTDARFHSLFENTPELILYQNKASIILDVNPAFLVLAGKSREEVVNHPFDEFLPPQVRGLFREKLADAFKGNSVRFEMHAALGNSAPRYWDVVKVLVREDHLVVGVHLVAWDITEKNQQHQEIFAQNNDWQQYTFIVSHNLTPHAHAAD